jgi:L-seryl-tRNA(Ser) seleniumtransferase
LASLSAAFGFAPAAEAARQTMRQAARASTLQDNIYTRMFNVRPTLGAFETLSRYGNGRLSPRVLQAMGEATEYFVDVEELNRAAGQKLATMMHAEAAMVTSCSFASMVLGAAACLTGTDKTKVDALPHPTWERRECLMQHAHRFGYDRAYRTAGATMVDVETREQLVNAISERTAFIAAMGMVERDMPPDVIPPKELVEIARKAGVPILIDSAGELPPRSTLTRYTDMGFDLVVVSGGKAIHGPSSTGILAGRKDLIEAAFMNNSPNQAVGRGMKVGREEIVGLMVALDEFMQLDEQTLLDGWTKKAKYLVAQLQGIPGLKAELRMTSKGYADVLLSWDRTIIPLTEQEVGIRLRDGEPRIAYMTNKIIYAYSGPTLVPSSLQDGEEVIVAKRLRQFFLE